MEHVFIMILSFVSHLVLQKEIVVYVLVIFTVVQALKLVTQMLTVGWASWPSKLRSKCIAAFNPARKNQYGL